MVGTEFTHVDQGLIEPVVVRGLVHTARPGQTLPPFLPRATAVRRVVLVVVVASPGEVWAGTVERRLLTRPLVVLELPHGCATEGPCRRRRTTGVPGPGVVP